MIPKELYNNVFKNPFQRHTEAFNETLESVAPKTRFSLISRYTMQKEAALMQEFDKELRKELGLPTYGKATSIYLSSPMETNPKQMTPTNSVLSCSKVITIMMTQNAITKDNVDNLTLDQYRRMCKKVFRNDAEIPSQNSLDNFKKLVKQLTIANPIYMTYALKSRASGPLEPDTYDNAKYATIADVCKIISEGQDKSEQLQNLAEKCREIFERKSNYKGSAAARITFSILSFGAYPILEGMHLLLNRNKFKDLPKRDWLHANQQMSPIIKGFSESIKEFTQQETSESTSEKEISQINDTKRNEIEEPIQTQEQTQESFQIGQAFESIDTPEEQTVQEDNNIGNKDIESTNRGEDDPR